MQTGRMVKIENYARWVMAEKLEGDLGLAHDYGHVERVRNWALRFAKAVGGVDMEMVQTAALLHDIGLAYVTERRFHGKVGAEKTAVFLQQHNLFTPNEIVAICEAIRCHTKMTGGGLLGNILRDADIMELLGAVGIMRGCSSVYMRPAFIDGNVKGEMWGIDADGVTARFKQGMGTGTTIMDHLNFQISCYENLQTDVARELGRPLIDYTRKFILQFEYEVNLSK